MRRDDLVGADIADADRLGDEADDVDRWPENGEGADDATELPGRNVAVPVENRTASFRSNWTEAGAADTVTT